jgi:ribosomal protein L11 methyltransferase
VDILEISVEADDEGAEAVAAVFNNYAYGGAVIEQKVTPEPGETIDPARPFTVRAFLLADESLEAKRRALEEAVWHLGHLRPLGKLSVREWEETDWAEEWKKYYTILHVGVRTVIKPTWLEYRAQPGELVIELDPGMAFGTGLHPTTRLCLAALEQYMAPGMKVLDVGTGSGILSIAAAKSGALDVDARDIDPVAVETARKNVALNRVSGIVRVGAGSITLQDEPVCADLIAVNILAETIAELAPALAHHLAPHGIVIASGILVEKSVVAEGALRAVGMRLLETRREGDWVALAAVHADDKTSGESQQEIDPVRPVALG